MFVILLLSFYIYKEIKRNPNFSKTFFLLHIDWAVTWDFNNVVCTISKGWDQPAHTRILIRAFASRLNILWLLTEQHLEFLSLKGGCTSLSESTLVKMAHCWKYTIHNKFSNFLCFAYFCAYLCVVPINFNCNDENRILGKWNREISDAIP